MNREIAWAVPELKQAYELIERIQDLLDPEHDGASYLEGALSNLQAADCSLEGVEL